MKGNSLVLGCCLRSCYLRFSLDLTPSHSFLFILFSLLFLGRDTPDSYFLPFPFLFFFFSLVVTWGWTDFVSKEE